MTDPRPVTGFHHVALGARDFDRTIAFYTGVLGLRPKVAWGEAPHRAAMLDAGDRTYLEVFERPDAPPPPEGEGAILHFALRTDDTDGVLERARASGAEVTMQPRSVDIPNTQAGVPSALPIRIAFFLGPDGEVVELFQNAAT